MALQACIGSQFHLLAPPKWESKVAPVRNPYRPQGGVPPVTPNYVATGPSALNFLSSPGIDQPAWSPHRSPGGWLRPNLGVWGGSRPPKILSGATSKGERRDLRDVREARQAFALPFAYEGDLAAAHLRARGRPGESKTRGSRLGSGFTDPSHTHLPVRIAGHGDADVTRRVGVATGLKPASPSPLRASPFLIGCSSCPSWSRDSPPATLFRAGVWSLPAQEAPSEG